LTASIDEWFTIGTATRILMSAARDVTYSFEPQFPYYIRSNAVAEIQRDLGTRWDIGVRAGGERMDHQAAPGVAPFKYVDQYGVVGGGLGVQFGRGVRVGLDGVREERGSLFPERGFTGYRFGATLSIGARPLRVRQIDRD
jgi:hypothetical protein